MSGSGGLRVLKDRWFNSQRGDYCTAKSFRCESEVETGWEAEQLYCLLVSQPSPPLEIRQLCKQVNRLNGLVGDLFTVGSMLTDGEEIIHLFSVFDG